MKEKRLLAMFITSAVTLVASLAVTFGVLMTLADPVVATGVVRYQYSFNYANNSLISSEGNKLKFAEDVIFQPSSSIVWDEVQTTKFNQEGQEYQDVLTPVWFDNGTYDKDFMYRDESISTKLKVFPIRIFNNYNKTIQAQIDVTYDKTSLIGQYTCVKIWDFTNKEFLNLGASGKTVEISSLNTVDYAVIVYVDDSLNTSLNDINWGVDYLRLNVVATDKTTV